MSQTINVGVIGSSGKMGVEIHSAILKNAKFIPYLGFSRNAEGSRYLNHTSDIESNLFNQCDVLIDFSLPDLTIAGIDSYIRIAKPIVIGTTGFSKEQFSKLEKLGTQIPVLWSANMSVGINILLRLIEGFKSLKDFDFAIEETHHIHKKDSPSGTALILKNKLEQTIKREINVPVSMRLGGIYGDHQIHAANEGEVISISHRALNRGIFAVGALQAANWLIGQKVGFYNMTDILHD